MAAAFRLAVRGDRTTRLHRERSDLFCERCLRGLARYPIRDGRRERGVGLGRRRRHPMWRKLLHTRRASVLPAHGALRRPHGQRHELSWLYVAAALRRAVGLRRWGVVLPDQDGQRNHGIRRRRLRESVHDIDVPNWLGHVRSRCGRMRTAYAVCAHRRERRRGRLLFRVPMKTVRRSGQGQ